MVKSKEIKINLPLADELFSSQEKRDEAGWEIVMEISFDEISDCYDYKGKNEWLYHNVIWQKQRHKTH